MYIICKSSASHGDGCTWVVFVVIAPAAVLRSPCLPNGQDTRSSPVILSPLVVENLQMHYRCHLNVPSSLFAPSLGLKGTEQSTPPPEVWGWGLTHRQPGPPPAALQPDHFAFLLSRGPLDTALAVAQTAASSPWGWLHARPHGSWDQPADHAQPAPQTTDLHAARGSCSHSPWPPLTNHHHCFSSPPLTLKVLSTWPDQTFQ